MQANKQKQKISQEDRSHFPSIRHAQNMGIKYNFGHQIAIGNFSTVFEASDEWGNQLVLKCYNTESSREMWTNEVNMLRKFQHPLIPIIHGAFEHDGLYYILMERCGTPLSAISVGSKSSTEAFCRAIASNLLQVVHFIHSAGYLHGDINPSNLLIDVQPTIKLKVSDLATVTRSPVENQKEFNLCRWNSPPEYYFPKKFSNISVQTDMYHVSLILLGILRGNMQTFNRDEVVKGYPQLLAKELNTEFSNALALGLSVNPKERVSAIQLWQLLQKK